MSLEWARGRRKLVQESKDALRIGNKSGIKFGNRDVTDLRLLPSLPLIRLEYFVKRLFKRLKFVITVVRQ